MYTGELRFHAPKPSLDAALKHLENEFAIVIESEGLRRTIYLDTFDWRLFATETSLSTWQVGTRMHLVWRHASTGLLLRSIPIERAPAFAADIEHDVFRKKLEDVIDIRALLPVVRVEAHSTRLKLLDGESKTVVTGSIDRDIVVVDERTGVNRLLGDALVLDVVRGYEIELNLVGNRCARVLGAEPRSISELHETLNAVGRQPLDYSSKLRVRLHAKMDMDEALRAMLLHLSSTMRRNEAGIFGDVDIEFLHDFRVSHRRTRTILDQFRKGFNAGVRDRFRPEFKWLGWLTNPVRDLDVYELQILDYRAIAAPATAHALAPLSDFLARRRDAAYESMVAGLRSPRYRDLMHGWHALLIGDHANGVVRIHEPGNARSTASRRIWSIYKKVIKRGSAIGPESPAEALHRLRLFCKHLRYLMEMFRTLYPPERITRLVNELKMLQDNLGAIQDLEVQRTTLEGFADEMAAERRIPHETMIAIGGLGSELSQQQRVERSRFETRFDRFARPGNQKRFRRLFA